MATKTKSEKRKAAGKAIQHRYVGKSHSWRVQSDDEGRFDECVVRLSDGDKGLALHAEMSDARSGYVDVCGVKLWFHCGRDGVARITMAEDGRACAVRREMPELRDPALDRKGWQS